MLLVGLVRNYARHDTAGGIPQNEIRSRFKRFHLLLEKGDFVKRHDSQPYCRALRVRKSGKAVFKTFVVGKDLAFGGYRRGFSAVFVSFSFQLFDFVKYFFVVGGLFPHGKKVVHEHAYAVLRHAFSAQSFGRVFRLSREILDSVLSASDERVFESYALSVAFGSFCKLVLVGGRYLNRSRALQSV